MDALNNSGWMRLLESHGKPFAHTSGWKSTVNRGVCCAMHHHIAVEIVYHRSGSGVTRLGNGGTLSFEEGGCVLYAPGLLHDQVMTTPGEDLCVHVAIPRRLARGLEGCLVIPEAGWQKIADWDLLTSGRAIADLAEKFILDLSSTALLLSLIRAWCRPKNGSCPRGEISVRAAEEFIRENYSKIRSLGEVASHIGLSHDRLRHLFQERRGITLVGFLTHVRIERAKSLLAHSILPLKQIASLCGFQDEFYFSAVFRKNAGCPPGGFRDRAQAASLESLRGTMTSRGI